MAGNRGVVLKMTPPKRKKRVNVVVKDSTVMNAIKRELEKLGCEVRSDVKKIKDSDFLILDSYFLELGLVNVFKKDNPLGVIALIGRDEEFNGISHLPCLCYCDKIQIKNHGTNIGKEVAGWFSENYGE
jgi:hypothetical protein